MTRMTGRCACNEITWKTVSSVLWAGHCHCDSCRRASSAPMTSFFGVARDSVVWTGEATVRQSSEAVERGVCPKCGSQVFIRSTRWPKETHLFAATLDEPALFHPKAHFHWAERVPWITVTDDLPKYAGSADGADSIPGV